MPCASPNDFFSLSDLAQPEERFDQLALAADRHLGKTLEPSSAWHFRVGPEPSGEHDELRACDLTLLDTIGQMPKERRGQRAPPNPRHR